MATKLPTVRVSDKRGYEASRIRTISAHWRDESTTDFTIVTDKGDIPVHRFVLMIHSLSLRNMIRMLGPTVDRLTIDNFPGHLVEMALEYMYTGEMLVPEEDLRECMVVVSYFQLDELTQYFSDMIDPFLKPHNLLAWRLMSERIDVPRVAMTVKRHIVKYFKEFLVTQQVVELDAIEMGKFMVEFGYECIDKDLLVEMVLRWASHCENDDPVEWLEEEEWEAVLYLFTSYWYLERDRSLTDSILTRTYIVASPSEIGIPTGFPIDKAIQRYVDRSVHPQLTKMQREKAEKLAAVRAPQHLNDTPYFNRWTLSTSFQIFKKEVGKHYEQKGVDYTDTMLQQQYDILMGNHRVRVALAPKLLDFINMKKCTPDYLSDLLYLDSHEYSDLIAESEGLRDVLYKVYDAMD